MAVSKQGKSRHPQGEHLVFSSHAPSFKAPHENFQQDKDGIQWADGGIELSSEIDDSKESLEVIGGGLVAGPCV
eukprot:759911-Hanusia_phi.AAC.11